MNREFSKPWGLMCHSARKLNQTKQYVVDLDDSTVEEGQWLNGRNVIYKEEQEE